ncbi:MAG: hypothetical protein AAFR87_34630 [Bacteroidota bacterium]
MYEQNYFNPEEDMGTFIEEVEIFTEDVDEPYLWGDEMYSMKEAYLNDIYFLTESLREVLNEDYQNASSEELEMALSYMMREMNQAEGFNFRKALRNIGDAGAKIIKSPATKTIVSTALPAAGTIVGGIYGGPAGAAVGGQLGGAAGQVFGSLTSPGAASSSSTNKSSDAGSAAASKLLALTEDPSVIQTLMALAMGDKGKQNVQVGNSGKTVGITEITKLLSQLASKAESDAMELSGKAEVIHNGEVDAMYLPLSEEEEAQSLYVELMNYNDVVPREDWDVLSRYNGLWD